MKKTFLARRNALLSSTSVSWGVLALAGAVLLLLIRLLAPNLFWYTFAPVFRASDLLAERSHAFFSSFGDATALTLENERLTDENATLSLKNQALHERVNDLAELGQDIQGIAAGVVARPPASPYDTLVVAAGLKQGVALGMEAFGEGGTPLGIVSSVSSDFSRVTLFSAHGVTTNGWVGQAGLPLIIEGAGGGALRASAARSAGIAAGDVVFVPGPGKLPIGAVVRVDSDPASPSVTLRIAPAFNLFSISWVELRDTGITAFPPKADPPSAGATSAP